MAAGPTPGYLTGLPCTLPKAQVSASMVTAIVVSRGTLTAAGPNPSPQHPVKIALAICLLTPSAPGPGCVTVNSGDLPKGFQATYSSPARP